MNAVPEATFPDPKDYCKVDLRQQLAASNAERDEAAQRETAIAEVLRVINSSLRDLAPVFDAMLEKALRLCESSFGAIWQYNSGYFELVAQHGDPKIKTTLRC